MLLKSQTWHVPTARGSDVIPLRKATKRRLVAVKGDASFDDLVSELLDRVPPEELRDRIAARRGLAPERGAGRPRDPEKQLMIADLAAKRSRLLRERGKLVDLGPRLFAWRIDEDHLGGERLRVQWPKRRRDAA